MQGALLFQVKLAIYYVIFIIFWTASRDFPMRMEVCADGAHVKIEAKVRFDSFKPLNK